MTLLSLLCGEEVAKMTQLMMEYDAIPPFKAGTPETADTTVMESLMEVSKPLLEAFWTQTQKTAKHLEAASR